jgi:hypothetical protein
MNIRHLKYEEIDKFKWDKCINLSFNGLVYAYSWYLDIVSSQWEALVLEDYQAVMPITSKKTLSFYTIQQPQYANQLGIFTSKFLNSQMVDEFLSVINDKFNRVELCLNSFNKTNHSKYKIKNEITYQLDLISPYKALYLNFDDEIKKKVKYYKVNMVQVMKHVNLKDFLLLKKNTSSEPITFENLNILRRIIPFAVSHNIGEMIGAYNNKNELISASFFIKSHQKSINLLSANSEEGHALSADVAILDFYIKENADQNLTLNFGESTINHFQTFAKGFGAIPVSYLCVKKKRWFNFSILKLKVF